MHARILLLPGSPQGTLQCEYAEQILTDISCAFDHSFSLIRDKLDGPVSDKILQDCENSQGILAGDTGCPGFSALLDALDMPLRFRSCCVPEALCRRHEKPVKMWLGTVLSLDQDTLRASLQAAFRFAREEDARILSVAPAGAMKAEWEGALRAQAAANPLVAVDRIDAPEAAAALISRPERLGLLLCPPYAGSILEAAATAACTHPEILYDFSADESMGIFGPCLPVSPEEEPLPYAMALAVARMLRFSLHLSREAACLEAAVQNVMANQEPEQTAENGRPPLDLICDQVSIAGELMGKGGILA